MQHTDIISINKELKNLYLTGKYKEFRSFLITKKSQIDPAQFYFNLGTIDLKLKDYGLARYHLETSIIKGRTQSDSYHNLNVVKQNINTSQVSFSTRLEYRFKTLPSDVWIIASMVIFVLLLIVLKFKKLKNWLIIATLVMLGLFPIGYKTFLLDKRKIAITLNTISFQDGPTKLFKSIGEIPSGEKLLLGRNNGNWWLIVEPRKYGGWVLSEELGFL